MNIIDRIARRWLLRKGEFEEDLRSHSATCPEHPAVKRLANLIMEEEKRKTQ